MLQDARLSPEREDGYAGEGGRAEEEEGVK